jgi:hypothetical protein
MFICLDIKLPSFNSDNKSCSLLLCNFSPHTINYGCTCNNWSYEDSDYCNGSLRIRRPKNHVNGFSRKAGLSRIVIIILLAGIIVASGFAGLTLVKSHSPEVQTTSSSFNTSQSNSSLKLSTTSTISSLTTIGSDSSTSTRATTTSETNSITTSTNSPLNVGIQNGELAPDFPSPL